VRHFIEYRVADADVAPIKPNPPPEHSLDYIECSIRIASFQFW